MDTMRRSPFILTLAIFAGTISHAQAATIVLRAKLSIAGCTPPIALTLRRAPNLAPEDFDQIVFRVGAHTLQFNTATPQMRLRPSVLNPPENYAKLKGISVDKTGYFLRGKYRSGTGERALLLFLGWPYASNPGSLLVLGFHSGCIPYRIFQADNFELLALQTDSAGFTVLIGDHSLSQVMAGADGAWMTGKPYATTYDPASVYRIKPMPETEAIYSLEDSRKYNQAHYCWAGPHMSETKAVVYNRTKKGQIECMSASRAIGIIH